MIGYGEHGDSSEFGGKPSQWLSSQIGSMILGK